MSKSNVSKLIRLYILIRRRRAVLALGCVAPLGGSLSLSRGDCSPGWCSDEANPDVLWFAVCRGYHHSSSLLGWKRGKETGSQKYSLRQSSLGLFCYWSSLWGVLVQVGKIHHLSLNDWCRTVRGVPVTAELRVHTLSGPCPMLEVWKMIGKQTTNQTTTLQPNNL